MRGPPPLTSNSLRDHAVTGAWALLAVGATLAWWQQWDLSLLFSDIRAFRGEPWRLLTCNFLHANFIHLAFNLYWLWVFGSVVEDGFGHLAAAALFLFLGMGSSALAGLVGEDGVGLSGVGYGLFGLVWVLGRNDERFEDAIDSQTAGLFLGWFVLCIVLTWTGTWNVGNIAHGAGAVLGALAGLALSAQRGRVAFWALGSGLVFAAVVAGFFWRPYLNLFGRGGDDFALLAHQELVAGRPAVAVEHYRKALALGGWHGDWWYNLGIAFTQLEQLEDAEDAYARAAEVKPDDREFRKALAACKGRLAYNLQMQQKHEAAVKRYCEALEIDGDNAHLWYNIAISYSRLGKDDDARAAFKRATELDPVRFPARPE